MLIFINESCKKQQMRNGFYPITINTRPSMRFTRGLKLYLSSVFIYGIGLLLVLYRPYCLQISPESKLWFLNYLPYCFNALRPGTYAILSVLFLYYLLLAPVIYYFTLKETTTNKPYLIMRAIYRNSIGRFYPRTTSPVYPVAQTTMLHPDEKVAILFMGVKFFFLPTMLDFFYGHLTSFNTQTAYLFVINLLFTIDTLIFASAYALESDVLRNRVKSVEPTFFGWLVTIICYPPFNSLIGIYIPWGANDEVAFGSPMLTSVIRVILVGLLVVYVWASLALGMKASNLTNRGIVTRFPYSIIRHPAYISKNIIWWITLIPVMNIPFAFGMGFWSVVYVLRAITEERHLRKDPDYVQYCERVRYRFVPGII